MAQEAPNSGRKGLALLAAGAGIVALIVFLQQPQEPEEATAPQPPVAALPEPAPLPEPTPPSEPAPPPQTAALPEPEPEPVPEVTPQTQTAEPAPAAAEPAPEQDMATQVPEPPALPAPSFGLVRVDAQGFATVSGTAAPRDRVVVTIDGTEAVRVDALADGSFAALFDIALSARPQVLALIAIGADGVERRGSDTVIVAPLLSQAVPEGAPDAVGGALAALPATDRPGMPLGAADQLPDTRTLAVPGMATDALAALGAPADPLLPDPPAPQTPAVDSTPQPATAEPAPQGAPPAAPQQTTALAAADPAPPVTPAAPTPAALPAPGTNATLPAPTRQEGAPALLLSGADGVRVLQAADASARSAGVVIDAIGYDEAGRVTLSGRADPGPPPARLRVYLDNQPINLSQARGDGSFAIDLEAVASGDYTLRVDELSADGSVTSRFETPFRREDPARLEDLRAVAAVEGSDKLLPISAITVQPGYTLWGIADDRYGDGFAYVKIFEANSSKIRDPDLIYPGQIFDLPD